MRAAGEAATSAGVIGVPSVGRDRGGWRVEIRLLTRRPAAGNFTVPRWESAFQARDQQQPHRRSKGDTVVRLSWQDRRSRCRMTAMDALRTVRAPRRRSLHNDDKAAAGFLLPWGLGLLLITIGPMLASLYLSFTDYNLLQPPEWIGLDNYTRMFADPRLLQLAERHLQLRVRLGARCSWPSRWRWPCCWTRACAGWPFYRSVYYLPSLLGSSVAIAILWQQIFGTDGLRQPVPGLLRHRGPGLDLRPDHRAGHADHAERLDVRRPDGDLPGRPAADPDDVLRGGRGRRRRHGAGSSGQHHAAAAVSPIIFFNLVLQIIHSFQSFTQAFVVSGGNGGPADSTLFYTLYLYQRGLRPTSTWATPRRWPGCCC